MKKTLIALLLCALSMGVCAPPAMGHGLSVAVRNGTADPSTCQPSGLNLFINRSSTPVLKICSAANTWTSVIGSGGGTFTGPVLLPDGTAAAPSLAFSSDSDGTGTGIFRSAANSIGLSTNGIERWLINASGSLNPATAATYDIGGTTTIRDIGIGRQAVFSGSTSGTITLKAAAAAGTNTITLPAGTTDFSATGGTDFVVKQESAGGALTVAQLSLPDLADHVTWTDVAFSAPNFTYGSGATWAIDAADQSVYRYAIIGKTMIVKFSVLTADVVGAPTQLQIAVPAGRTATSTDGIAYTSDAGGAYTYTPVVVSGAQIIFLRPGFTGSWTATATDNTAVRGTVVFEIQ